jgi:hypothetical protein
MAYLLFIFLALWRFLPEPQADTSDCTATPLLLSAACAITQPPAPNTTAQNKGSSSLLWCGTDQTVMASTEPRADRAS